MVSQQIVDIIIKAQDQASDAAKKVDDSFQKLGNNTKKLGNIPVFDTLKTKVSSVASTIDGKFGGAFSKIKNTVTSAGSTIKSKLGGAIDGVRNKLSSLSNAAKNVGNSFSFLKGAVSMAAGMIGYDLFNSLMQTTRASLNARSGVQAFANRLNMSSSEVSAYQKSLDELQMSYKKIDMDVVGQQATDMAYRLGLPKTSLTELTETTAIFTDAMQRNGRSAEDSMLAMSDAMDGQFVRLKEIGIGQDDLMKNGWSGDINDKTGLLKAMNKALKDLHYDDLAKSVDTLDDAWQVLSITLSNLLESIILPLTPAIVGIVTGLTNAVNGIKDFFTNNGWAQGAALIAGLAVGFVLLAGSVVTAEGAFIGLEALMPGFIASLYGAASGFMAITIAGAPLWAIVAAVAAIAIAVYEVGIAFGWWSDVGSMIDAVWAGLQRLWSAFINHPDVQAAISAITWALGALWNAIVQAGQGILEFFGVATGGEFDVVRAIIDGVSAAWEAMTFPIRMIIMGVEMLIGAFQGVYETSSEVWGAIMGILSPYISEITNLVLRLITIFDLFKQGQMDLPTLIVAVLSQLWTAYVNIVTMVLNLVVRFGTQLLIGGMQAGSNFVNGVVSWLRQLPGRALALLMQVVSSIVSAGAQWVSNAKSKAGEVVSGVVNKLSSLPGDISSALSGVVSAITSPFQSAYDAVCGVVDSIKSKVQEGLEAIGSLAQGGGEAEYYAGVDTIASGGETYTVSNEPVTVKEELRLVVDLQNVPSDISEKTLIETITSKPVLSALVGNDTFQRLDSKAKEQIASRNYRANGA